MPGTSHEFEHSILNELPPKTFDAVIEFVNFLTLEQIIMMLIDGINPSIKSKYPRLNDSEWDSLVKKVCLTRLTAIRITHYYSKDMIRFLLSVALKCMNCDPSSSKAVALSHIKSNQVILALWLGKCYKMLEVNH